MQIKDLDEKDCIKLNNERFIIQKKKPTGEAIIVVETAFDWDEPRPDGKNSYQRQYGNSYFPVTKLCERLKQGQFKYTSDAILEILTPVTKTYKTPNGWHQVGAGKETVTLWGYPAEGEVPEWQAHVDEYGIRRKSKALTPNRRENLKIFGVVKADIEVKLDSNRREWVVILPGVNIDLNNFLIAETCEN